MFIKGFLLTSTFLVAFATTAKAQQYYDYGTLSAASINTQPDPDTGAQPYNPENEPTPAIDTQPDPDTGAQPYNPENEPTPAIDTQPDLDAGAQPAAEGQSSEAGSGSGEGDSGGNEGGE